MSALFGFVARQDDKRFGQMRDALSHRGQTCLTHFGPSGSIGLWRSEWESGRHGSGIEETTDGVIVLSGFQTPGSAGRILPLSEIAASLNREVVPGELSGDFVIAFLNGRGDLFLVRDGSGARTVYYGRHREGLYFASEPKGIWNVNGFPRVLDPNSVAKYLTFSFIPGAPTMLKDIREVEPGSIFKRTRDGVAKCDRYFRFEDCSVESGSQLDRQESVDEFRKVLSSSVEDRLDVAGKSNPVLFLSGGLDSSVIGAELTRQASWKVRTFSLHFGKKYPNELEFAKSVSERLGTKHQEVLIEPKSFLGNLRSMIWHLDDPIGDPITMPNFELAQRVKDETDFVFNGEGGDPCFGGPKNIPMMLLHWYGVEREPHFREKAYLASYRRAYEELDHIFTPEFKSEIDLDSLTRLLTPFFECERPVNLLDKLTAINIRLKGAHLILPKVERMLAAAQISPLSPLFSSEMVELSYRIPSHLKLERGIEKVILKEAFRNELPSSVIDRPKSGMRVPVHFWFQGELRKYARKVLSPRVIKPAGIFNHRRVKQLLDYNIEEGNGRYGMRLWMLLTFEIWRRMVIDKKAF